MFGDGASNQGTFGETMNLAALWKLPVVFLVVNNQYGMGTALVAPLGRHRPLARRPSASACPGERVDGMDVLAVRECVAEHLRLAREDRQPTLVEALTYRFRGHSAADPEVYRTKEEVAAVARARPDRARTRSASRRPGCIDDEGFEERDRKAIEIVDEAVEFADASPEPALESLYDNVYVLGDQVQGWYSVDERTPEVHRGEDEREVGKHGVAHELAEAGAALRGRRRRADAAGATTRQRRRRPRTRPTRRRTEDAADGHDALPRGAQPGACARRCGRDESVFLMGEDVGVFQGAFKVTRGTAGGVRREARARHADLREHDRRHGRRRRDGRACARSSRS